MKGKNSQYDKPGEQDSDEEISDNSEDEMQDLEKDHKNLRAILEEKENSDAKNEINELRLRAIKKIKRQISQIEKTGLSLKEKHILACVRVYKKWKVFKYEANGNSGAELELRPLLGEAERHVIGERVVMNGFFVVTIDEDDLYAIVRVHPIQMSNEYENDNLVLQSAATNNDVRDNNNNNNNLNSENNNLVRDIQNNDNNEDSDEDSDLPDLVPITEPISFGDIDAGITSALIGDLGGNC